MSSASLQISVSRTGPYGALAAKNGPTGSAYITFRRNDDARRCIESIHGTYWEGGPVFQMSAISQIVRIARY